MALVDVGTVLVELVGTRSLILQPVSTATQLSLQHREELVAREHLLTGDAALLLADVPGVPGLGLLAVQKWLYTWFQRTRRRRLGRGGLTSDLTVLIYPNDKVLPAGVAVGT